VETATVKTPDGSFMFWRRAGGRWQRHDGAEFAKWTVKTLGLKARSIRVVLTMAHLTHDPLRNEDSDLAMLCQWCHLNYDKLQHRETRCNRKDAARPLLYESGFEAMEARV
jgi:heterodisulfide reductase subunit B